MVSESAAELVYPRPLAAVSCLSAIVPKVPAFGVRLPVSTSGVSGDLSPAPCRPQSLRSPRQELD